MKHPPMTRILSHFKESARLAQDLLGDAAFLASMEKGAHVLVDALRQDAKILSCGNGGSMCDAMHFAEELSGRYRDDRPPFSALALSDLSAMTCVGNDYGFDQVFARQVQALGRPEMCCWPSAPAGIRATSWKPVARPKPQACVWCP